MLRLSPPQPCHSPVNANRYTESATENDITPTLTSSKSKGAIPGRKSPSLDRPEPSFRSEDSGSDRSPQGSKIIRYTVAGRRKGIFRNRCRDLHIGVLFEGIVSLPRYSLPLPITRCTSSIGPRKEKCISAPPNRFSSDFFSVEGRMIVRWIKFSC